MLTAGKHSAARFANFGILIEFAAIALCQAARARAIAKARHGFIGWMACLGEVVKQTIAFASRTALPMTSRHHKNTNER